MAISNLSTFAQLITGYRRQKGMSQGQLAQATRLSRTYIYHLEAGMRSNPSPHVTQTIARALGLQGEERRQLYNAFTSLTGQQIDDEQPVSELLELVFDPGRRKHYHGWENLARRLVSDFQYNSRTITHLPEYKKLLKHLRDLPDFRRIASATHAEAKPAPSFTFPVQHSKLGRLTLRTAISVFTGINSYSMVSYVPGDQHTLEIYRKYKWQPE